MEAYSLGLVSLFLGQIDGLSNGVDGLAFVGLQGRIYLARKVYINEIRFIRK